MLSLVDAVAFEPFLHFCFPVSSAGDEVDMDVVELGYVCEFFGNIWFGGLYLFMVLPDSADSLEKFFQVEGVVDKVPAGDVVFDGVAGAVFLVVVAYVGFCGCCECSFDVKCYPDDISPQYRSRTYLS